MFSSTQQLAYGAAILATSFDLAHAGLVSGKTSTVTSIELIKNTDATTPKAKSTDGVTTNTNILNWKIENVSWIDEDTAESYLEITNTLTGPILATDKITFHVEFTSSQ